MLHKIYSAGTINTWYLHSTEMFDVQGSAIKMVHRKRTGVDAGQCSQEDDPVQVHTGGPLSLLAMCFASIARHFDVIVSGLLRLRLTFLASLLSSILPELQHKSRISQST